MRPIGPKVQTQVPPETYSYIEEEMANGRREADVVRELVVSAVAQRRKTSERVRAGV